MTDARWADLVDRLLSRKLALCLLMIVLALIGFWSGNLTFPQLMTAAITAAGVYSATNAVETIATRPAAPTAPMVTVEAPAAPVLPVGRFSAEQLAQLAGEIERRMRETPAPASEVTVTAGDRSVTTKTWPPVGTGLVSTPPTWLPAGVDSTATVGGLPVATARTGG